MNATICVGMDIGGTATRIVTWLDGAVGRSRSVATASFADPSPDERVARLAGMIRELLPEDRRLAAVGIGASGPVDVDAGVVHNPYTLPAFSGFPLVAALAERLGCLVSIESDAVVAAVAEHRRGAGEGARRMLMVTLGTGIGVAFLVDGQPFRGRDKAHPEGGHIPIVSGRTRCYCGLTGCWEQAASRGALQARLRPLVPDNVLDERLLEHAAAAAPDDPAIRRVFATYGARVGRGLSALHALYMPEVTVLGGSAAALLALFAPGMEREIACTRDYQPTTPVRRARVDDAGAVGAALLAAGRVGQDATRSRATGGRA